jgi:hypothetical protein
MEPQYIGIEVSPTFLRNIYMILSIHVKFIS